jgi:hypothetical protein
MGGGVERESGDQGETEVREIKPRGRRKRSVSLLRDGQAQDGEDEVEPQPGVRVPEQEGSKNADDVVTGLRNMRQRRTRKAKTLVEDGREIQSNVSKKRARVCLDQLPEKIGEDDYSKASKSTRRGRKSKPISLEDLPQGLLGAPAPLSPDFAALEGRTGVAAEGGGPAYPTVILQARQNMQRFENCVLLTRVGGFYELYFGQAEEYGPLLNLKVAKKETKAGPVAMVCFEIPLLLSSYSPLFGFYQLGSRIQTHAFGKYE